MPPAFSQSAAFFACVTSPAKAGPVKASAKAKANVDTSIFMVLLLTVGGGVLGELRFNASCSIHNLLRSRRTFWISVALNPYRQSLVSWSARQRMSATMSHLFAAILLFLSPGCPHEEPTCITPTEHVEVNLTTPILPHVVAPPVNSDSLQAGDQRLVGAATGRHDWLNPNRGSDNCTHS